MKHRSRWTAETDAFSDLTRRKFIVIDCETTWVPGGKPQRVVSFAAVTVLGGIVRRNLTTYRLVNPGVPINTRSTAIHGITDADVAKSDPFATHIAELDALLGGSAILVAHNATFDVPVLRNEYALAGATLPDVAVLDTMELPGLVGFTHAALSDKTALADLAPMLGVATGKAHDARDDALATAGVLIALLRHAANVATVTSIDDLLTASGSLTTATVPGTGYLPSRNRTPVWAADPEHEARHGTPVPTAADKAGVAEWLDRAAECARLRCPALADELATVPGKAAALLIAPLAPVMDTLTEPGQAATLLGAVAKALSPRQRPRQEVTWWMRARDAILAAPECSTIAACPDCRAGDPCPLDVAAGMFATSVIATTTDPFSAKRVDEDLDTWARSMPEVAAAAVVLAMEHLALARQPHQAAQYLAAAEAADLVRLDPRLAVTHANSLVGRGQTDDALALLREARSEISTDPNQVGVTAAIARLEAHAARLAKPAPVASDPARTRPATRRRPNPYRPSGHASAVE